VKKSGQLGLALAVVATALATPAWAGKKRCPPGYAPFAVTLELSAEEGKCAGPGLGSPGSKSLLINGDEPFVITSIIAQPSGEDELNDEITAFRIGIDGTFFVVQSGDLTQLGGFPVVGAPFDVLGDAHDDRAFRTSFASSKFPTQLTSNGDPDFDDDIEINFTCRAGTSVDLGFSHFRVSGWKLAGAEVTLAFGN
jgi:hypothetical protein